MGVFPDPGTSNETRTYCKGFVGRRTSSLASLEGTYSHEHASMLMHSPIHPPTHSLSFSHTHTHTHTHTRTHARTHTHIHTQGVQYTLVRDRLVYRAAFGKPQFHARTLCTAEGNGVMDVRAKSLIAPQSQLDEMNDRLSAINRESRGIFPSNVSYVSYFFFRTTANLAIPSAHRSVPKSYLLFIYRRETRSDDFRVNDDVNDWMGKTRLR